MIKAITIDFWNTLFDSSGGAVRNDYRRSALLSELSKYELDIGEDLFESALKASWMYFNNIWRNEMRTPEVAESVAFFWNYLNLPKDDDAVERLVNVFADSILVYPPNLLPDVKEQISILSQQYKLCIVSDTGFSPGNVLRQLLDQTELLEHFTAFSFSDETGVSKPHPKAFQYALDKIGVAPENAVHIGDIEATDIVGAKQFGMKAIRYSGDPTAVFAKENPTESQADAEIHRWSEVARTIENI